MWGCSMGLWTGLVPLIQLAGPDEFATPALDDFCPLKTVALLVEAKGESQGHCERRTYIKGIYIW